MFTKGNVIVKNRDGNILLVQSDDPRIKSKEFVGLRHGKVSVKDKDGNTSSVSSDDPRLKTGELTGVNKNTTEVFDENGKIIRVSIDNQKFLSGEYVSIYKNTVQVRDKSGKSFRVPKDDPRLKTGELVGINKGYSVYINRMTFETVRLSKEEYLKSPNLYIGVSRYTVAKDKYGNLSIVPRSDIRLKNGELESVKLTAELTDPSIRCKHRLFTPSK